MSLNSKEIMEQVVDYAKKKGADGSDVILDSSAALSFKSQDERLEEYKVSSSQVAGIRVIKNNRAGISYSQSLDQDSLHYMVDQALANASYAKEDEFEQITVKNEGPLECVIDEEKESIDIQRKVEFSISLETQIKEKGDHVKSAPYNGFTENDFSRSILNSQGSYCHHQAKNYYCYTSALLEKEGKNSMYWGGVTSRTFAGLNKEKAINDAYNVSNDLLDAAPINTGKYSVIFDCETMSDLFGCYKGMFSAKSAIYGINPFKDKIGKKVAIDELIISDNPLYREGMGYSLFDDEGSPHQEVKLIENGVLSTFLHNSATAKKLGTKNTFSATRSTNSSLGVGGSNTFIQPGKSSESDLYTGSIFEIVKLDGLHSGTDFVSGDFSCGASGYLWKNGQRSQAVKGVTISGNFYKMLLEIEALGSEIKANDYKTFFAPLIRFAPLTVAGS